MHSDLPRDAPGASDNERDSVNTPKDRRTCLKTMMSCSETLPDCVFGSGDGGCLKQRREGQGQEGREGAKRFHGPNSPPPPTGTEPPLPPPPEEAAATGGGGAAAWTGAPAASGVNSVSVGVGAGAGGGGAGAPARSRLGREGVFGTGAGRAAGAVSAPACSGS